MLDLIDLIVFQFMNTIRTSYVMTKRPVMHFNGETEH